MMIETQTINLIVGAAGTLMAAAWLIANVEIKWKEEGQERMRNDEK